MPPRAGGNSPTRSRRRRNRQRHSVNGGRDPAKVTAGNLQLLDSRFVAATNRRVEWRCSSSPEACHRRVSITRVAWPVSRAAAHRPSQDTVPRRLRAGRLGGQGARGRAPLMAEELAPSSVWESAAQFRHTYDGLARFDFRWNVSASSSLPTPVSPVISTDGAAAAARRGHGRSHGLAHRRDDGGGDLRAANPWSRRVSGGNFRTVVRRWTMARMTRFGWCRRW